MRSLSREDVDLLAFIVYLPLFLFFLVLFLFLNFFFSNQSYIAPTYSKYVGRVFSFDFAHNHTRDLRSMSSMSDL
jgi:positive regulator of sigma E activity